MALPERLYALRKKSGLSQEQLAEQLNVSRQAISKWESGTAVPESSKLIAISQYFHISLDDLIQEDGDSSQKQFPQEQSKPQQGANAAQKVVGLVVCIGGILCLLGWGLLSMLSPAASQQIGDSSMITIDGNGVFLLFCAAAILVGAVLLLKDAGKK